MRPSVVFFLVCLLAGCAVVRPATRFPDYFSHEGRTLLLPFACVLATDGEHEFIRPDDVSLKKKERIVARMPEGHAITLDRSLYRRELAKIFFFFECHTTIAGQQHRFILDASWPANQRIYEEGPNQPPEATPGQRPPATPSSSSGAPQL